MSDLQTTLADLDDKVAALTKIRSDLADLRAGEVTPTDPDYQAKLRADVVAENALVQARAAVLVEIAHQAANIVRSQGYMANKAAQVLQTLSASAKMDGRFFAAADTAKQYILDLSNGVDLRDADAKAIDAWTRNFVAGGGFEGISATLYDAIGVTPPSPTPAPEPDVAAASPDLEGPHHAPLL